MKGLTKDYGVMDDTFAGAFEERRRFVLDFYADGAASIVEHDTYLSKEELDAFVVSAANEIAVWIMKSGILPDKPAGAD